KDVPPMFAVPLEVELSVMFEVAEASEAAVVEHKALIVSGNVYVWRHSGAYKQQILSESI
ncbi:hypothetical protein J6590_098926, partial [Homalodisca vitripennis]